MTSTSSELKKIVGAARPLIEQEMQSLRELNAMFMDAWKRGTLDEEWSAYRKSNPGLYLTYYIRMRGLGDIKIGKSNQVKARFLSLFTAAPRGLDLVACYPADRKHEGDLKQEFAHLRLCGEWFRPGRELVTHLELIGVDLGKFSDAAPAHFLRRTPEKLS